MLPIKNTIKIGPKTVLCAVNCPSIVLDGRFACSINNTINNASNVNAAFCRFVAFIFNPVLSTFNNLLKSAFKKYLLTNSHTTNNPIIIGIIAAK